MSTILELKNITAGYEGIPVLKEVNLAIKEQDFIGIIGPNGGGKTTLLKVILGLLKPFSGDIHYYVSKTNLFGYLPQNSQFDRRFPISVREVVMSGLMSEKKLYRYYSRQDKSRQITDKIRHGRLQQSSHRRTFGRTNATGVSMPGNYFISPYPDSGRTDDLCGQ